MPKLHEILAVEKSRTEQSRVLIADAGKKFGKSEYFSGHYKTLKMISDSPENEAIENSSKDSKELPTTVVETLSYVFQHWAVAEDVIFQKNTTNQLAKADIEFRGNVIASNVPVDELMGLEHRLLDLRKLIVDVPTLSASVKWEQDQSGRKGAWRAVNPEVTTKTEKTSAAVVLYEATDKHPAQIEKVNKDVIVGTFTKEVITGAATSLQKANSLQVIDDLLASVKQARMRANSTEIERVNIGKTITDLILAPFNELPQ